VVPCESKECKIGLRIVCTHTVRHGMALCVVGGFELGTSLDGISPVLVLIASMPGLSLYSFFVRFLLVVDGGVGLAHLYT